MTSFKASEALNMESMGSPTLKMLAMIPLLSHPILLYNSQ